MVHFLQYAKEEMENATFMVQVNVTKKPLKNIANARMAMKEIIATNVVFHFVPKMEQKLFLTRMAKESFVSVSIEYSYYRFSILWIIHLYNDLLCSQTGCACNEVGSLNSGCDPEGNCSCKPEFKGVKCKECSDGHFGEACEGR